MSFLKRFKKQKRTRTTLRIDSPTFKRDLLIQKVVCYVLTAGAFVIFSRAAWTASLDYSVILAIVSSPFLVIFCTFIFNKWHDINSLDDQYEATEPVIIRRPKPVVTVEHGPDIIVNPEVPANETG